MLSWYILYQPFGGTRQKHASTLLYQSRRKGGKIDSSRVVKNSGIDVKYVNIEDLFIRVTLADANILAYKLVCNFFVLSC